MRRDWNGMARRADAPGLAGANGSAQTAPAGPIRAPSWAYWLVTLVSLLVGATSIVRGTSAVRSIGDSDLTNFFFKSATYILNGDPWHMYAVRGSGVTLTYPNYNPPLSVFLMAPLLGLAQALGLARNYGEQITFVSLPFVVFVPLLGYAALQALRFLHPEAPETLRLLLYIVVTLSPLTWQSYSPWYHLEQPMMLLFLVAAILAFQMGREGMAGALAGLAVLSRTTAALPLLAFGALLLLAGQWRALLRFGGTAVALVVVVMAPFFLFDRADATYSFLSWRGTAEIGGDSVWSVFAAGANATGIRHTLDALARRLDSPAALLFVLVAALLVWRRRRVSAYARDAWAVLALGALATPMLSKTVWPYYYLEPFLFLLVWEFSTLHDRRAGFWRWPVLSVSYLAVTATLSQYIGLPSVGYLDRVSVGLLNGGALLAFAFAIWSRLQAVKPEPIAARVAPAPVVAPQRASVARPAAPVTPPRAAGPGEAPGARPPLPPPSSAPVAPPAQSAPPAAGAATPPQRPGALNQGDGWPDLGGA